MTEVLARLLAEVRAAQPVDPAYLFFAGYLTPNGELHLGHIGGPYLRADAAARHLRTHGAHVTSMTAADSYESGVTYAAVTGGAEPAEIAAHYVDRARLALAGLDIEQTVFLNGADPGEAADYARLCADLAAGLGEAGRLHVRTEQLFATGARRPAYAVAAFLAGTCPFCAAKQSGNVCERCGRWMPPESLDEPWLAPGAGPPRRGPVRSVFLDASDDLATAGERGRVEPAYAYLAEEYVQHHGPTIRMTLPLPWGVPWEPDRVPGLGPITAGSVHSSYLTGKYASTRLVGRRYQKLFGVDPFAPDSSVTTVAVGGLDSAMGWLSLLGLTGPGVDFRPFDYFVVNRFLLLRGSKFSTSRRHVIRVNDALDKGQSPDAVRLMLARAAPSTREADFVPEEAARRSAQDAELLQRALRAPTLGASDGERDAFRNAAYACLLAQREAFSLPAVDLPAAADALLRWAAILRGGVPAGEHVLGREVLATLAYPLIPRWATGVWRGLGRAGHPGSGFGPVAPDGVSEAPAGAFATAPVEASEAPAMPAVHAADLIELVEIGRRG